MKLVREELQLDASYNTDLSSIKISFESVADKLYETDEIQAILNGIKKIYTNYCINKNLQHEVPFMFIQGSSGKGKTQSSFCIQLASKPNYILDGFKVLYFPSVTILPETTQAIYRYYRKLSNSLVECLKSDFE